MAPPMMLHDTPWLTHEANFPDHVTPKVADNDTTLRSDEMTHADEDTIRIYLDH